MSNIVYDTPLERLQAMLPALDPDQRAQAKARLKAARMETMQAEAERWLERQHPAAMGRPVCVAIKQWRGEALTSSFKLTHSDIPGARILRPEEVVCVDMDDETMRGWLQRNMLEITESLITRPIVYPSKDQAYYSDPARRAPYGGALPPSFAGVDAANAVIVAQLRAAYSERVNGPTPNEDLPEDTRIALAQQAIAAEEKAAEAPAEKTTAARRGRV